MAEVIWSDLAKEDLQDIYDYIFEDSESNAEKFILRLIERTYDLKNFNRMGRIVEEFENENIRELIEGNYRIIYRLEESSRIGIARIHHSSRLLKSL